MLTPRSGRRSPVGDPTAPPAGTRRRICEGAILIAKRGPRTNPKTRGESQVDRPLPTTTGYRGVGAESGIREQGIRDLAANLRSSRRARSAFGPDSVAGWLLQRRRV